MHNNYSNFHHNLFREVITALMSALTERPEMPLFLMLYGYFFFEQHILPQRRPWLYEPEGNAIFDINHIDHEVYQAHNNYSNPAINLLTSPTTTTDLVEDTQSNSHSIMPYMQAPIHFMSNTLRYAEYLQMELVENAIRSGAQLTTRIASSTIMATIPIATTTLNIIFPFRNNAPTLSQMLIQNIDLLINKTQIQQIDPTESAITMYPDCHFINKTIFLSSMMLLNRQIAYQTTFQIAQVSQTESIAFKKWHWLHLQNLLSEIQKNSAGQEEVDTYRLLNLSFKWLQTLYLDANNLPSAYHNEEAINMAAILKGLIQSTDVYMPEETPNLTEEQYIGSSNGLDLTIGITDFISEKIIQDHQPLNLEVLLKRTSDDVNISMKLVDAYLENHDQTIKHLINQVIYYATIYLILVACISTCLILAMTNPIVSLTIVSSLVAIPLLASIYVLLAPNPLNKKPLKRSERELQRLARQRDISEHDRDFELDSLLNNIGSIVIYYENLVTKILYGLIIGTLITALVAFPLIFAGIHVFPILAVILTAVAVSISLFRFLKNRPNLNHQSDSDLVHNQIEQIYEIEPPEPLAYLSTEHLKNTLIISSVLFFATLFQQDESILQNHLFRNSYIRKLATFLFPMHPLISDGIMQCFHLWDELDKGNAGPEVHAQLREITQNISNQLPRDSIFNKSIANIVDQMIELHSLDNPPSNLTDFIRAVIRISIPYLPRLLAGTNEIQNFVEKSLLLAYPELEHAMVKHYAANIQRFLISPSVDQTEWFNTFAQSILDLDAIIESAQISNDGERSYRKKWKDEIVLAAKRIVGLEENISTIRQNPIINIIQGFLEITQDALYRKRRLTIQENQIRDLLIRYSIMIQDIKYTEDLQYQFVTHYQYCWAQIPKIYFPTILTLGLILLATTPFGFSIPIVAALLIGGLFLLPWLTTNTHKITRINEASFDNLKEVATQADNDIKKDAFLSPLLSSSFKSVSDIFCTARGSLRQLTTVTVCVGVIILLIIASTMALINPYVLGAMALVLLLAITFNMWYERYVSLPTFKDYHYNKPGQADHKLSSGFFSQPPTTRPYHIQLPAILDQTNNETETAFVAPNNMQHGINH